MASLRDFYENAIVDFKYVMRAQEARDNPDIVDVLTEEMFKRSILPRVHFRVNSYAKELGILNAVLRFQIPDPDNRGEKYLSFDLSAQNSDRTRLDVNVMNNLGGVYAQSNVTGGIAIYIPDTVNEDGLRIPGAGLSVVAGQNTYGLYGYDGNTLQIYQNAIGDGSDPVTHILVGGTKKLPVVGMHGLDLDNIDDTSIIGMVINSSPDVYAAGIPWAISMFQRDTGPMVESNKANFDEVLGKETTEETVLIDIEQTVNVINGIPTP